MEYRIVSATMLQAMSNGVNLLLMEGYVPFGQPFTAQERRLDEATGVHLTVDLFCQAVVRYPRTTFRFPVEPTHTTSFELTHYQGEKIGDGRPIPTPTTLPPGPEKR